VTGGQKEIAELPRGRETRKGGAKGKEAGTVGDGGAVGRRRGGDTVEAVGRGKGGEVRRMSNEGGLRDNVRMELEPSVAVPRAGG